MRDNTPMLRRLPAAPPLAALALALAFACTGGGGGGGGGPTNPTSPVVSLAVSPGAIGVTDFADVTVQVTNGGAAQAGVVVQLSTTLGNLVDGTVTTGTNGSATTRLRGDGRAGVATVTARLPATGAAAQQTVRIGQGVRVTLRAQPDAIAATGTAEIFAVVTQLDGSSTPAGVPVDLTTTLGQLSDSHPRTDAAGTVHVQLRGDGRAGTAALTATTANAVETARAEVTIGGSLVLALQASPVAIPRDGSATLIVVARDAQGAPAPNVALTLATTRGRIDDPTPRTDGLGQAITTLRAQNEQGRARVTVSAGGTTTAVDVELGQGLTLLLRASPPSIARDGNTLITLLATTPDGRAVPIGTTVLFATTLGRLDVDRATVDETALASTILRGTGSGGRARVTAQVSGFAEQAVLEVPIG